jgi:hypothetical protein
MHNIIYHSSELCGKIDVYEGVVAFCFVYVSRVHCGGGKRKSQEGLS